MQVADGLPTVGARVDDEPAATIGDPLRAGERRGDGQESSGDRCIGLGQVQDGVDVVPRHEQQVDRRPGG